MALVAEWVGLKARSASLAEYQKHVGQTGDFDDRRVLSDQLSAHTAAIRNFRARLHEYHQQYGPAGLTTSLDIENVTYTE
jgi:hypothetical protein